MLINNFIRSLKNQKFLILSIYLFSLFVLLSSVISIGALTEKTPTISTGSVNFPNWEGAPYLDSTFGDLGVVETKINEINQVGDMVVQSNGKIIAVGLTGPNYNEADQTIIRYLPNGDIDTTFGTNGVITRTIMTRRDPAYGVALQQNGKIVVAGHTGSIYNDEDGWITISRYEEDGTPDNLFGSGPMPGIITTTIGINSGANDVVVYPTGEILVAGYSTEPFENRVPSIFTLVRYTEDGSLDSNFGQNGTITTTVGLQSRGSSIKAIALQNDYKILAAGYNYYSNDHAILVRYKQDGSLDETFGNNGIVANNFGSEARFLAVAIQEDGKILAGGEVKGGIDRTSLLIARYNSNGTLDTDFANGGVFSMTEYGHSGRTAFDVKLAEDGKIVVTGDAGFSEAYAPSRQLVIVLQSDGSFSNYWVRGWTQLEGYSSRNFASKISILDDGNFWVLGSSDDNFLLTKYIPLLPQSYIPLVMNSD